LLLLDEATSNLDSESERLVQEAFQRVRKRCTMIVVAHRLATIWDADIIFVIGDGSVLEKGSHAELIAKRGHYWQMVSPFALIFSCPTSTNPFSVIIPRFNIYITVPIASHRGQFVSDNLSHRIQYAL
jgi:energy-coupling factor transporter ATP-binding protein EcfA2